MPSKINKVTKRKGGITTVTTKTTLKPRRPKVAKKTVERIIERSSRPAGFKPHPTIAGLNKYARTLLDPEDAAGLGSYQHDCPSIPDDFSQPTARWTSVINTELPTGNSVLPGPFSVVVTPNLSQNYWVNRAYGTAVSLELAHAKQVNGRMHLFNPDGTSIPAGVADCGPAQLWAENGAGVDVVKNYVVFDSTPGNPGSYCEMSGPSGFAAFVPHTANGITKSYLPVGLNTILSYSVFMDGNSGSAPSDGTQWPAPNWALTVETCHADFSAGTTYTGPGISTPDNFASYLAVEITNAADVYISKVTLNLLLSVYNTTIPTATLAISEFFVNLLSDVNNQVTMDNYFVPYSVPQLDSYLQDFQGARCVAQSALLTYRGSSLNGGAIAGRRFSGVEVPFSTSFNITAYSSLSQVPHSYDSNIQHGAYGFYLPQDYLSNVFRNVSDLYDWGNSYLIFTGQVFPQEGTVTDNQVRLRIVSCWEGITLDQKYQPTPGDIDPIVLHSALKQLSSLPSVCPNDSHLANIMAWLRQASGRAYTTFKPFLPGLAQAAGTAITDNPAFGAAIGRAVSAWQ